MSNNSKKTESSKVDIGQATIDALKTASIESSDRSDRYEKIYAIEQRKWPHNMGDTMRSDIPIELHDLLDECITKSQIIARNACQTTKLTEEYLKNNKYD